MADDNILQDRLDRLNRIGTDQPAIVRQALSAQFDALEAAHTSLVAQRRQQQGQEVGVAHGGDHDTPEAFEIWACRHIHPGTLDLVCGFRFDGDIARIRARNRKTHLRIGSLAAKLGVTPRVLTFVLGAEIVGSETAHAAIRGLLRKLQPLPQPLPQPQPQQALFDIAQRFSSVKASRSVHRRGQPRRRWGNLRCFQEAIIHYLPDDPDPTLWPINKGTKRQREERQRKAGDEAEGDEDEGENDDEDEEGDREADPEQDEHNTANVHPSSGPEAGNASLDQDPPSSSPSPASPLLRAQPPPPPPPPPPPIPLHSQHDDDDSRDEAEEMASGPQIQGAGSSSGSGGVGPRDIHDDVAHFNASSRNKEDEELEPYGGTKTNASPEAGRGVIVRSRAASVVTPHPLGKGSESGSECDIESEPESRMQDQPEDQDGGDDSHHDHGSPVSQAQSPSTPMRQDYGFLDWPISPDGEHNNSMEPDQDDQIQNHPDQDLNQDPDQDEAALALVMIKEKSRLASDGESIALENGSAEEQPQSIMLTTSPALMHDETNRSHLPPISTPTATPTTTADSEQPRRKQHDRRSLLPTFVATQEVLTGIAARLQGNEMLSDEDIVFCLGHRLVGLGHDGDDDGGDGHDFQVFQPGFPYHDSESGKLRRPETLARHLLFFFNYKSHWTLGHLDRQAGLLTHYDSYQSYDPRGILGLVEARMRAWALDHMLGPICTVQCEDMYPQQEDSTNCGIFAVECAASLITSRAPPKSVNPGALRNIFYKMARSELQEQSLKTLGHVIVRSKRPRPDAAAREDHMHFAERVTDHEVDSYEVNAQAHEEVGRRSPKRRNMETRGQQQHQQQDENGPKAAGIIAGGASSVHPTPAQPQHRSDSLQAPRCAAEVAEARSCQQPGWVLNTLTGLDSRLGTSFSTSLQKFLSHDGPLLLSGLRKEQARLNFDRLMLDRELAGLNEQQEDGEEGGEACRNHDQLPTPPVSVASTDPSTTSTSADAAGCSSPPTASTIIQRGLEMARAEEQRMAMEEHECETRYTELTARALSLRVDMTPEEPQRGRQVHSDLTQGRKTGTVTTATTTGSTTNATSTATGQARHPGHDHKQQQQALSATNKSGATTQPIPIPLPPQPDQLRHALGSAMAEASRLVGEVDAISRDREAAHSRLDAARARVEVLRASYVRARRSEVAEAMARIAAQMGDNRLVLQWLHGLGWG